MFFAYLGNKKLSVQLSHIAAQQKETSSLSRQADRLLSPVSISCKSKQNIS